MKLNYIFIPLIVIVVAVLGNFFTAVGINNGWYAGIAKPLWTPTTAVIGAVWSLIFVLSALSAIIAYNAPVPKGKKCHCTLMSIFLLNAMINITWSFVFFVLHMIGFAVIVSALLEFSVLWLIIMIWPISRIASLLLAPYAVWVLYATYLTYGVFWLNTVI